MQKCGIMKLELNGRHYMDKHNLIALYNLLNKLAGITDPDSLKAEAIACTMLTVKEELRNRYNVSISLGR